MEEAQLQDQYSQLLVEYFFSWYVDIEAAVFQATAQPKIVKKWNLFEYIDSIYDLKVFDRVRENIQTDFYQKNRIFGKFLSKSILFLERFGV